VLRRASRLGYEVADKIIIADLARERGIGQPRMSHLLDSPSPD